MQACLRSNLPTERKLITCSKFCIGIDILEIRSPKRWTWGTMDDMGCSSDASLSVDEPSTSSGKRIRPSEPDVKKKRQRSTADPNWKPASDNEDKKKSVSNWTLNRVNDYGLYYENKASDFFEFYDLFNVCKGKNKHGFQYPLHGEELELLNSLVKQTNNMINQHGVEKDDRKMWGEFFDWVSVKADCVEAVKNLTKDLPETRNPTLMRSHSALINFYRALNDHFQEKIDNNNFSTEITEEPYTELLSEFFEIFLLKPRRGIRKSVMKIQGQQESSVPDLRLTIDPALNLLIVEVVEVKRAKCKDDESALRLFNIRNSVDSKVLAQHAGELLIDFQRSVFGDLEAVFGIICMQTSLIFTCLKITQSHCANIREYGRDLLCKEMKVDDRFDLIKEKSVGEEEEESDYEKETKSETLNAILEKKSRKSGAIFYTKPYNYLVTKDRRDIMEFLFWIGINCNRKFTP